MQRCRDTEIQRDRDRDRARYRDSDSDSGSGSDRDRDTDGDGDVRPELRANTTDYKLFEPDAAHLLCGTDMLSSETVVDRFQ